MRSEKGFTLIEMMIVVGIIGILAGMSWPNYLRWATKARLKEAQALGAELERDVTDFHKAHGRFPRDNAEAGLPAPSLLPGNYVRSVTVDHGALHVTLGNRIEPFLRGKVFTLHPYEVVGSPKSPISWGCGRMAPPEGMRSVGPDHTDVDPLYLPGIHCL